MWLYQPKDLLRLKQIYQEDIGQIRIFRFEQSQDFLTGEREITQNMGSNIREYRRLYSRDCNDKFLYHKYETRYPIHNEPVYRREYKSVEKIFYNVKKLVEIYCGDNGTYISHWKIRIYVGGPGSPYI